jgi:hypothetical protein
MRSLLAIAFLATSISATAADGRIAATDPREADADFPFVGEYVGYLTVAEQRALRTVPIGLQVVARGNGRFDAVEYLGGLPGAGWDGRERAVLPGRREGNVVQIDAVPVGITLDGVTGVVGRPGSSPVYGVLRRINRASPTLGMSPPREATILFDGRNTDALRHGRMTDDGLLIEGAETRDAFSDFTLHVEFRLPYMPAGKDQGRANSGVYLQRRYEVQILDSFGQEPAFNGAASLYRTRAPDLNMSFPPLVWQTYDIRFRPARFEDGKKVANARITVWHNGVKVHDDVEIPNKTGAGRPEGPEPMPILFQDHRDPVRFRNIWIVDHTRHPHVDATPKIDAPPPTFAPPRPLATAPVPPSPSIRPVARQSY